MLKKILANISYLKAKGFFDLLSVNFLTQFLGFGSLLLVAKFLTSEELGAVKILQSYTAIFVILAGFGFNSAVLKVCAEDRTDNEKDGILRLAVSRAGITTIITMLLIIALAVSGLITSSQYLSFWLIVYATSIPLQVLAAIFIVFLLAKKQIKEMARSQAIVKIQSVIIIVACSLLWGFKGFIFATIAAYALGLWPFLRQIKLGFLTTSLEQKPPRFMKYALFSMLANGINQMGQLGDVFILDHFTEDRATIGYYALALIFIAAARQVTGTVQSITTPYFSEHDHDETWFRHHLIVNQGRMAGLSVLVAVGVFILAWIIVPLVYGTAYSPALVFLAILLIKYIVWSSSAVMGAALLGLGMMHYSFVVVAIATPIGLMLSYLLLQQFGVIGVAWGQVGASVVQAILIFGATWLALKRTFRNTSLTERDALMEQR